MVWTSSASMALIVMAKKGYGDKAKRRYPNLAGKVNLIYEDDFGLRFECRTGLLLTCLHT
jgi:hypothetical protein